MNLPKSYFIGQEYSEGPIKIPVIIKYRITIPVVFNDFDISIDSIRITQNQGSLLVLINKNISEKLFYDIVAKQKESTNDWTSLANYSNASKFIIGYIKRSFPLVIDEIYKKKYTEGHILIHTISLADIFEIAVIGPKEEMGFITDWPILVGSFPFNETLTKEANSIFIRDLMEAMTNYLGFNINDSIRMTITSLENYFIQIQINKKEYGGFKGTIDFFITEDNFSYKEKYLSILRDNIKYIYDLRNSIVHNKLRISASDGFIAKKAIGTLQYLFQNRFTSSMQGRYIHGLVDQFLLLDGQYGGINLDFIEEIKSKKDNNHEIGYDNIEEFIFQGLRISEDEKKFNIE